MDARYISSDTTCLQSAKQTGHHKFTTVWRSGVNKHWQQLFVYCHLHTYNLVTVYISVHINFDNVMTVNFQILNYFYMSDCDNDKTDYIVNQAFSRIIFELKQMPNLKKHKH